MTNPIPTRVAVAVSDAFSQDPLAADLRNFIYALWRHLGLPKPTPLQYDIAEYLQDGPKRRIIEAFRGVGKSWLTAGYVLWRLYREPNERILVVSASKERADAFSIFVKRLICEVPFLAHLQPRAGQRDSNIAFDVGPSAPHQAPSVRSVGIMGQLTGGRASIIVADDVEVPKNSLTQPMRDKLAEAVKEFDAVLMTEDDLRAVGLPRSEIIYLGTPQTEGSLYNTLPGRGYKVRIWPARYPTERQRGTYGERLAPFIADKLDADETLAGKPTEPLRFNEIELIERELSYGKSGFALQFMLDTAMSDQDRYPLKLSDLMVMGLSADMAPTKVTYASGPDLVISELPCMGLNGDRWHRPMWYTKDDFQEYSGVVMAIDPAGRGGDELTYAVVAMLNGFLYVLDVKGFRNGYADENLEALARAAKRWKVKNIIIEENFGDGMFSKLFTPFLTRIHPVTTEELKHSAQKERRIIDTLEPLFNQHRVIINEALVRLDYENYNDYSPDKAHRYQLFYQITRITPEKNSLAKDDRVDALAMACAYWAEQMDRDVHRIEEDRREQLRDMELRKFMQSALGYTPAGPSWNDSILN